MLTVHPILARLAGDLDVAAAYAAIGRDGATAALFEIARIDDGVTRIAKIGIQNFEVRHNPFRHREAFEALMALAGVLAAEMPHEAAKVRDHASPDGRLAGLLRMPLPGFVHPALAWTLHALRLEAAEAEAVAAREAVESAFDSRPVALEALVGALTDAGISATEARARALALRAAAVAGRFCDIPKIAETARLAATELIAMEAALAAATERQEAALKALPLLSLEAIRGLHTRAIAESEAWLARGGEASTLFKVLLDSFPPPDPDAVVALSPRLHQLLAWAPALAAGRGRVAVLSARRRLV